MRYKYLDKDAQTDIFTFTQMTPSKSPGHGAFLLLGILLCLISQSFGATIAVRQGYPSHPSTAGPSGDPIIGGPGGSNGWRIDGGPVSQSRWLIGASWYLAALNNQWNADVNSSWSLSSTYLNCAAVVCSDLIMLHVLFTFPIGGRQSREMRLVPDIYEKRKQMNPFI